MANKIGGRFHVDTATMMMFDREKELQPFSVENYDQVARSLFERAIDRLAKVLAVKRT